MRPHEAYQRESVTAYHKPLRCLQMKKTNAMRALEAQNIQYLAIEYDPTGDFHPADEVARMLQVPVESVYKTLVVLREHPSVSSSRSKPLLVMIAAALELDLRILARGIGEKKLRMATQKEAEKITGAQVGGISALALLGRGFEVYIDKSALGLETIHVSGGVRGLDLNLRVADLLSATGALPIQATSSESAPTG